MRSNLGVFLLAWAAFSTGASAEPTDITHDPNLWMNVTSFGEAHWLGNEIHLLSTGNWFLLTKKRYRDFTLELEVTVPDVEGEYVNRRRRGHRPPSVPVQARGAKAPIASPLPVRQAEVRHHF